MSHIRNLDSILQQMLHDVIGETYQDKLNHLANCNCCQRHQINKPTIFQPWTETSINISQNIYSCSCNCRHVARFICRQTNVLPPLSRTNSPTSVIDF